MRYFTTILEHAFDQLSIIAVPMWAYPVLADIRDQETWGLRKDVQHHGEPG